MVPQDLVVHLRAGHFPRLFEVGGHPPPVGPHDPQYHHLGWILRPFYPLGLLYYLSQSPVVSAVVNLVNSEKRLVGIDLDNVAQVPR